MDSSVSSKDEIWFLRVSVAYQGGRVGCSNPPSEILKALQNCAKLNAIVKTVKNC